jgi:hypothetical protein
MNTAFDERGTIVPMLSQDQFAACIDALIQIGVVKRVKTRSGHDELIQLDIPIERLVGRIVAAGYEEPPVGEDFVSWFAVVLVKVLLDEKGMVVSGEELAGMASVVLGFISESSAMEILQSRFDRPVVANGRRSRNKN